MTPFTWAENLERMFETRICPSAVGARTELEVAVALEKVGRFVYLPFFGVHGRVDLIYLTADAQVRRVQCKTARLKGDAMVFYTCSHTGGIERNYRGEAEEFGVYCPELDSVYLVPVDDVPTQTATLRIGASKNNQTRGIRWAEDYRLK